MDLNKIAAHCMKTHKKKKKMVKKANQQYGYGAGAIARPKMMARGGVVNKPTLAMIGEAGPEAVIPLGKSKSDKKNAKRVAKKVLEKTAMNTMPIMPMKHHGEFNDAQMLMRVLRAIEEMAEKLQCEVECGCEMPSWVEYKIYKSYDSLLAAMGYTFSRPKPKAVSVIKRMM